ncbi:MAG: hypothetical protein K2M60_10365, partial [Lachnospiraceae bacterium]|nr:hypothetical protein [Lachnospiraceae bacterium]
MKVSTVTDNAGRTVSYSYEKGLLTTFTRCDGTKITYTYDENENLNTITDSLGNTYLENRYDEKGRVIEQKLAGDACYTFTYDEKTRTNTVTDEQNNTSTHYT